jgi:hypothetical protein
MHTYIMIYTYMYSEGVGSASAKNMAIETAAGFWICILDAGDFNVVILI